MGVLPRQVLVVDDDPFMRRLLTLQLQQLGCTTVQVADGGTHALTWLDATAEPPEAIVLDLHMPGLDGLAVVAGLADRRFSGTVLLISGEDEAALQAALEQARAMLPTVRAALRKPAKPEALAAALQAPT